MSSNDRKMARSRAGSVASHQERRRSSVKDQLSLHDLLNQPSFVESKAVQNPVNVSNESLPQSNASNEASSPASEYPLLSLTSNSPVKHDLFSFMNCMKSILFYIFPIFDWLPKYIFDLSPHCFAVDVIAGLTLAAVAIPQALAYARLANLPPVYGLYASLFPVFIYCLTGTTKQLAVGPFALTCLMLSRSIQLLFPTENYVEAALAFSWLVGCWQLIFAALPMGPFLLRAMTVSVMQGFTTAAAWQVITSQIEEWLGLPKQDAATLPGLATLVFQWIHIVTQLKESNIFACLCSFITLIIQLSCMRLHSYFKWKRPLPDAFLVVILFVIVMSILPDDLVQSWHLRSVGPIPNGIPHLMWPRLDFFLRDTRFVISLLLQSFTLAAVAGLLSLALAQSLALSSDPKQELDPRHELLAHGLSNTLGPLLSGIVSCASVSRCALLEQCGSQSLVSLLVATFCVLMAMLFVGNALAALPSSCLAGIIIMALWKTATGPFWKWNKMSTGEKLVFLGTCVSTTLLDLKYGLIVGIFLSQLHQFITFPVVVMIRTDNETNSWRKVSIWQRFKRKSDDSHPLVLSVKCYHEKCIESLKVMLTSHSSAILVCDESQWTEREKAHDWWMTVQMQLQQKQLILVTRTSETFLAQCAPSVQTINEAFLQIR